MIIPKQVIKTSIVFSSIALAFIVLLAQVYIIMKESPLEKKDSKKIFLDIISKAKYCEERKFNKYTDILVKCALAFVSGCLLSEMKFLKTGII